MEERWYLLPPKEQWLRYQVIYERHQAGETYVSIAQDVGLSISRVHQLAHRWQDRLELADAYHRNKAARKPTDHISLLNTIFAAKNRNPGV